MNYYFSAFFRHLAWFTLIFASSFHIAWATPPEADQAYERGYALQREMRTLEAIEAYKEALKLDPFHGKANYEIGWSYWVLRQWQDVVRHWEVAQQLEAGTPELPDYLALARERLSGKAPPLVRVAIGTKESKDNLTVELTGRFQHFDPKPDVPEDHFDPHIFSPKSVLFTPDGQKAYVNALEGHATLVYNPTTRRKIRIIPHRFGKAQQHLFNQELEAQAWSEIPPDKRPAEPTMFLGKPVEMILSHQGRFLWVSYYRRDFDTLGVMPSVVAVIETRTDKIIRLLPTGPIPKALAYSPEAGLVAVIHWGDNTVGLIDVKGDDPASFKPIGQAVVEKKLPLTMNGKVNRDNICGYCLRGSVFTKDGKYLLVSRMGGGGIAVVDAEKRKYIGSVWGMKPTPRHLELSSDGERVYVSSSASGYVSMFRTQEFIAAAKKGRRTIKPLRQIRTGTGTRTIALSPDDQYVYAAINNKSKLVILEAKTLKKVLELPADSFPVGLAVSPDSQQVWLTSQGRKLRGGNSVSLYTVTQKLKETPPADEKKLPAQSSTQKE